MIFDPRSELTPDLRSEAPITKGVTCATTRRICVYKYVCVCVGILSFALKMFLNVSFVEEKVSTSVTPNTQSDFFAPRTAEK